MKRLTLSVITLVLTAAAFTPVAQASSLRRQVSTVQELGEGATFIELVRANRDARNRSK